MLAIGRTIIDWRKACPALSAITFKLSTDNDAENAVWPRSVIDLQVAGSDTAAVVPFRLTETIHCSDDADDAVGEYVEKIVTAQARFMAGDRATVHRLQFMGVSYETDMASVGSAVIQWEGVASWRRG